MHAVSAWLFGALLALAAADATSAQPDGKPGAPIKPLMRPASEHPSAHFAEELAAANTEAIAEANRLRALRAKSPPPPNCERRVLRVGMKASGFRVRPGQHVLIGGCLGGVLPGVVRLNGTFPGGYVTLQVDEWTDTYVHARVPDLKGVFDGPVRLQLRFGDGSFSNELLGEFLARRAAYEIEPVQFGQFLDAIETTHAKVCGWNATCAQDAPGQPTLPGSGGVMAYAQKATSGTLAIKGHHRQHQVVGYFARSDRGASQFSHWGPAGELMVDWATEPYATTHHVSVLVVSKFIVDAPVATMPGARPHAVPPFVPSALVR